MRRRMALGPVFATVLALLGSCDTALGPRAEYPILTTIPETSSEDGTWAPGLIVMATVSVGEVHYTIDESLPTIRSPVFPAEGLVLNETTTIRAITVERGYRYSYEAYGWYPIAAP